MTKLKPSRNLAFDLALTSVAVLAAVLSLSFGSGARQLPLWVAGITTALLLTQVWEDRRIAKRQEDSCAAPDYAGPDSKHKAPENGGQRAQRLRGPLRTFAFLIGFVLCIAWLGYLIAVPVFMLSSMIVIGRISYKEAATVTGATWLCVYLLFEVALDANLA